MKRRCSWAGCTEPATVLCHYWGQRHRLCFEHADLIGDDDTDPTTATDA